MSGWVLRLFDVETPTMHVARFISWMRCGERNDYAWVELDPPLARLEPGREPIGLAVLAPRHEGIRLNEPIAESPVHVMVLAAPDEIAREEVVPPDALSIVAWATIEREMP
jgi:hypothetical protein